MNHHSLFALAQALLLLLIAAMGASGLDECDRELPELTAAQVHEELLHLTSQEWQNVTGYTHARSAGFVFTHSYRSMSRDGRDGVPAQYLLTTSPDGYYTRLAMRLYYGQTSDASNPSGTFNFSQTVLVVSTNAQSGNPNNCLRRADSCPGSLCETVTPVRIDVSLQWPIDGVFGLNRQVSDRGLPFSYVSIDGYGGPQPAVCQAQDPSYEGTVCADPLSNCNGMMPCDGASIVDQSDVDTLLELNCGPRSDPWTQWEPELNGESGCLTACCNPAVSWHQRWGIGPEARVYSLSTPTFRTSLLRVTVTNLQTGVSTSLDGTDLSPGAYNINGAKTLRTLLARNYALPTTVVQQLQGTGVVVWGEPGAAPTTPQLVPTALQSGGSGGWAYLNRDTLRRWTNPSGGFELGQGYSVSAAAGFGAPDNCNNNYYSDYDGLAGWELDPDTSLPLSPSPCQMSEALNQLAANFTADPGTFVSQQPCQVLLGQPSPYLPPGYSLQQPNYVLNELGGTLTRSLNAPGCGISEVAASELYIDLSTVLMAYLGPSASAGVVNSASGCGYSFAGQLRVNNITSPSPSPSPGGHPLTAYGTFVVAISNPVQAPATFRIHAACNASTVGHSGSPQWNVSPLQPNDYTIQVVGGGSAVSQPMQFVLTGLAPSLTPQTPLEVDCGVQVFLPDDPSKPAAAGGFRCYNITTGVIKQQDLSQTKDPRQPCDSVFDSHCPAGYSYQVWMRVGIIGGVALILVALVFTIIVYYCSRRH